MSACVQVSPCHTIVGGRQFSQQGKSSMPGTWNGNPSLFCVCSYSLGKFTGQDALILLSVSQVCVIGDGEQ